MNKNISFIFFYHQSPADFHGTFPQLMPEKPCVGAFFNRKGSSECSHRRAKLNSCPTAPADFPDFLAESGDMVDVAPLPSGKLT